MSLTKYMINLGKPVAYFPNLKRVAGSTNANLLLCQLIYWCDKTKDNGWIWKNSMELEAETGLSYNEQRSARKRLVEQGIIEERERKTMHRIDFRVNQERLNELWEKYGDGVEKIEEAPYEDEVKPKSIEEVRSRLKPQSQEIVVEQVAKPKPDIVEQSRTVVDALLAMNSSKEGQRTATILSMKDLMRKKLHINPSGSRWDSFIEFAYIRQTKHNEPLEVFVKWALNNRFDPVFWTPEKMSTLYPQAFITTDEKIEDADEQFTNLLPQIPKDKKSAPMPKSMRKSNDW